MTIFGVAFGLFFAGGMGLISVMFGVLGSAIGIGSFIGFAIGPLWGIKMKSDKEKIQ